MKIVSEKDAPSKERKAIDYDLLADYYNRCEVGDAVEMDKVYNITLFKKALANFRGVVLDVDFQAFNKGDKTYVKRLTTARIPKD